MPRTLNLDQAAELLFTTPETVADCIKHRGLQAARIGRAYVLIEDDVINWLRTQYPEATKCDSTNAQARPIGTPVLPAPTANELASALAPNPKRRRKNSRPTLRMIAGDKGD